MTFPATFEGFPRACGRPGIRNQLALLSPCGLTTPATRKIAALLPQAVVISSPYGRGQLGADKQFHDQMFTSFGTHPNIGAAIVLAADSKMRLWLQDNVAASGRLAAGFSLQECGEDSEKLVASAVAVGREFLIELARAKQACCSVEDLILAVECGHSDATSGLAANPLAGELADSLIAAGGAVVIAETIEWLGTQDSLYTRCKSPQIAARLKKLFEARHQLALEAGRDLRIGNPGPQNHEGGITTLQEKSHGAISKGGTSQIAGVLAAGETVPGPGLHLMDTPTLSPESISSMVAGGAQLVLFTTGQGNPYGSAVAPTLKLTANPQTAIRLPHQIDFDGSDVFVGARSRQQALPDLSQLMIATCNGMETAAERLQECAEVISRLGPSI